jgi:hypothetical protein
MSDEIDRRIQHAEQRIKFWVVSGVAANLLILVAATLPTAFYLGQLEQEIKSGSVKTRQIAQR